MFIVQTRWHCKSLVGLSRAGQSQQVETNFRLGRPNVSEVRGKKNAEANPGFDYLHDRILKAAPLRWEELENCAVDFT